MHNMGVVHKEMGDYEKALRQYAKDLKITSHVRGLEHLDTAKTHEHIAIVYRKQGKHAEALELYTQVLAVKENSR